MAAVVIHTLGMISSSVDIWSSGLRGFDLSLGIGAAGPPA